MITYNTKQQAYSSQGLASHITLGNQQKYTLVCDLTILVCYFAPVWCLPDVLNNSSDWEPWIV